MDSNRVLWQGERPQALQKACPALGPGQRGHGDRAGAESPFVFRFTRRGFDKLCLYVLQVFLLTKPRSFSKILYFLKGSALDFFPVRNLPSESHLIGVLGAM